MRQPRADAPWAVESRPVGADARLRRRRIHGTQPACDFAIDSRRKSPQIEQVRLRRLRFTKIPALHEHGLTRKRVGALDLNRLRTGGLPCEGVRAGRDKGARRHSTEYSI